MFVFQKCLLLVLVVATIHAHPSFRGDQEEQHRQLQSGWKPAVEALTARIDALVARLTALEECGCELPSRLDDILEVCVPGGCDDDNPCTVDSCNLTTGACVHDPAVGNECDDGNPCTVDDSCQDDGSCMGSDIVCDQPDDPCLVSRCEIGTKGCTEYPVADCEDGDVSTSRTVDACKNGVWGWTNPCPSCEFGGSVPQCVCNSGFANCDGGLNGCETDVNNDPNNCGACGSVCRDGEVCAEAICSL